MNLIQLAVLLITGLLTTACDQPESALKDGPAKAAERIVTLAPNLTELVFAIGAGDRLVGTVEYSDFPAAALNLPRVGDSFRVDYESLGALQPDLVLAWGSGNPPEVIERVRELGYRVVSLEPTTLDSVAEQMLLLGTLLGSEQGAAAAASRYRVQLTELSEREHDPQLSVFWQISADPWFTVTGQHVISEIIALCGGRNIFTELPGLAPAVTLEAILAERPDVIIASVLPGEDDWKEAWQSWSQLPAVKQADLYAVAPDLVSRSGPRIVEGAARVCDALEQARN